jgi:penicillin-binding protein 1A
MRRLLPALLTCALMAGACTYRTEELPPALPANTENSRILASDGTLITELHAEENRRNIALAKMPDHFKDAVVAIEDERFWEHEGVDVRAIFRAARRNAQAGRIEEGGSTITQQYVKNALLDDDQTIGRKIEEASLAMQIERRYSKELILELYLNTIYFGQGAYGCQAAAFTYFGKPISDVTLAESALLAGLIRTPAHDDPFTDPDAAVERRDVVLDRMLDLEMISEKEHGQATTEPLALHPEEKEEQQQYEAAHFVEEVKKWILTDARFGATPLDRLNLLFGGGIRIETTIDMDLQRRAEAAVLSILPDPATMPHSGVVIMEPDTGYVRAMVGGPNFWGAHETAKFNLTTDGPGRPTGSSFKPIVLAAALEKGIALRTVYGAPGSMTIPIRDGPDWNVSNYGGGGGGAVDLIEATVRSYNTVYAQLIMDVGVEESMRAAARYGIQAELLNYPSAVLGANDVHVTDMAAAFSTLANRGVRVPPTYVTRVTRLDGTVLYNHEIQPVRVLSSDVADAVTWVLTQVVERGTGTAARLDRPVAGKTGTGQDWKDAWFVGYTPDYVAAVWVGYPTEGIPMTPPRTPRSVTGGFWPAQIWKAVMTIAHEGLPPRDFPAPPLALINAEPPPRAPDEALAGEEPAPQSPALVSIPNVVGRKAPEAAQILRDAGFVPSVVGIAGTGDAVGVVIGQSPPGGSTSPTGVTVILEVSI